MTILIDTSVSVDIVNHRTQIFQFRIVSIEIREPIQYVATKVTHVLLTVNVIFCINSCLEIAFNHSNEQ